MCMHQFITFMHQLIISVRPLKFDGNYLLKLKIGKQEYDIGIKTSKGYWNTYKNGTLIKVESSPSPSPLNSDK